MGSTGVCQVCRTALQSCLAKPMRVAGGHAPGSRFHVIAPPARSDSSTFNRGLLGRSLHSRIPFVRLMRVGCRLSLASRWRRSIVICAVALERNTHANADNAYSDDNIETRCPRDIPSPGRIDGWLCCEVHAKHAARIASLRRRGLQAAVVSRLFGKVADSNAQTMSDTPGASRTLKVDNLTPHHPHSNARRLACRRGTAACGGWQLFARWRRRMSRSWCMCAHVLFGQGSATQIAHRSPSFPARVVAAEARSR